jgi:hypothetical protein
MLDDYTSINVVAAEVIAVASHRRGGPHHRAEHGNAAESEQEFSGLCAEAGFTIGLRIVSSCEHDMLLCILMPS